MIIDSKNRPVVTGALLAAVALLSFLALRSLPALFEPLSFQTTDRLFELRAKFPSLTPELDAAVVMIDVDNLKSYNDVHGHLRGSFLLKELAGVCAEQVRSFDVMAKYGGDEFTMILPQTPRDGAMVVAERVRAAVCERAFALVPAGRITVSLGVATFPDDGQDSMGLLASADRALYQAKRLGRNRVEFLEDLAA